MRSCQRSLWFACFRHTLTEQAVHLQCRTSPGPRASLAAESTTRTQLRDSELTQSSTMLQ